MKDYPQKKMAEITHLITDGKHGDCENEENSGYYFLSSKDLRNGKLLYEDARQIKYDGFIETHRRTNLKPGDILLANCGASIGRVGIAQEDPRIYKTTFQKSISVIKANLKIINNKYLYYYTFCNSNYLIDLGGGTAQPNLLIGDLKKIKIPLPPIPIQCKIAAVLSAYDDLIENNNRRIAILEKMAEELYREWFVRLRFPGHEKVKIVKGVPEGWEVKKIGELIESYIGGGWGADNQDINYSLGAYVIRGTDIPDLKAGKFDLPPFRYHKPSNYKSRSMKPGDIVFEVSGGSKDQLLGRSILITKGIYELCNKTLICASFCKMIRPSISSYFLNYYLQAYYKCGLVGTFQIQSTGISNYQFESFLKYQSLLLPTHSLLDSFDSIAIPLTYKKEILATINHSLLESRDRLLARLMSDKIDLEQLDIKFPASMQAEELTAECAENRRGEK